MKIEKLEIDQAIAACSTKTEYRLGAARYYCSWNSVVIDDITAHQASHSNETPLTVYEILKDGKVVGYRIPSQNTCSPDSNNEVWNIPFWDSNLFNS